MSTNRALYNPSGGRALYGPSGRALYSGVVIPLILRVTGYIRASDGQSIEQGDYDLSKFSATVYARSFVSVSYYQPLVWRISISVGSFYQTRTEWRCSTLVGSYAYYTKYVGLGIYAITALQVL